MTLIEAKERFRNHRFGVFTHFLYSAPGDIIPEGFNITDWNARCELFDCERVAKDLHDVGVGYYIFTVMQGNKYMAAPNATFDRIAGTKPGEACAKRDLIMDLARALQKYDIDLFLYFTGDGPYKDEDIGVKFGFLNPRQNVSVDFVKKWASVMEEYAVRYGDLVKGWWLDGCYDFFGYDMKLLEYYAAAAKKGNHAALVSMNNGISPTIRRWYEKEDFTSGEFEDFTYIPNHPDIGDSVAHILAPLGDINDGASMGPGHSWCHGGCHRDGPYMREYVKKVNEAGGVVSIDIQIKYDSTFDPKQLECLSHIK